jgi:hypothetical protein
VLVKGKPRTRGIPEGPSAAAGEAAAAAAAAADGGLGKAGGSGVSTEEAAAEMFLSKPSPAVRAHVPSHPLSPSALFCAAACVVVMARSGPFGFHAAPT